MNERIKKLADQAGYTKDMFGIGHWDMPECQKFAELIVRECLDIGYKHKAYALMGEIMEHFGVEE
jgi:hypothetical protein